MKRSLRKAHTRIWIGLTILIPLIILAAVFLRQSRDELGDPVRLSNVGTMPAPQAKDGT